MAVTIKNPIFTYVISRSPSITSEKLIGSENYLSWSTYVELWFMGQGYEDHLETFQDQILGNPSVSSLDDVFARLLRISSTQTLPFDSTSDSFVLVSQTNPQGGRSGNRGRGQRPHYTYCNKLGHTRDRYYQLHGQPPRTAHVA